jgi:hypothetical protein
MSDALDLSSLAVANSPSDIASWPATATITRVTFSPANGISVEFDKKATWPDFVIPGWDGPICYTLWLAVPGVGTSGFIQMWRTRPGSGAYETGSFFTDYHKNWAYDGRWGALSGYVPKAGDEIGVFVSAGNARGVGTGDTAHIGPTHERSNVVKVVLPATDVADYHFDPTPVPTPVPGDPVPTPTPVPPVPANLQAIVDAVNRQADAIVALQAKVDFLIKNPPSYSGGIFGYKMTLTPIK